MADAIPAVDTYPYLHTQTFQHSPIAAIAVNHFIEKIWLDMMPVEEETSYSHERLASYQVLQGGRIQQIMHLLEGYLPAESSCNAFARLLHLIWNAVKACFGCSDFQKARSLLKSVFEENIRFELHQAMEYYTDNDLFTQETQDLLDANPLLNSEEARKAFLLGQLEQRDAFTELQAIQTERADLECLVILTEGAALWECFTLMTSEDQRNALESTQSTQEIWDTIMTPALQLHFFDKLNDLLLQFPDSTPANLEPLFNHDVWKEELDEAERDSWIAQIGRWCHSDFPLHANRMVQYLLNAKGNLPSVFKSLITEGQLNTLDDLTSLFQELHEMGDERARVVEFINGSKTREGLQTRIDDSIAGAPEKIQRIYQTRLDLAQQMDRLDVKTKVTDAMDSINQFFVVE
jgi:hypothetical protein